MVAWNLRRLRVKRGFSQERLAYDAEVDRSYVGGLERQEGNPTVDVLERLARTLAWESSLRSHGREQHRRSRSNGGGSATNRDCGATAQGMGWAKILVIWCGDRLLTSWAWLGVSGIGISIAFYFATYIWREMPRWLAVGGFIAGLFLCASAMGVFCFHFRAREARS